VQFGHNKLDDDNRTNDSVDEEFLRFVYGDTGSIDDDNATKFLESIDSAGIIQQHIRWSAYNGASVKRGQVGSV